MPFDPTRISGLIMWLDATQATTLTNSDTDPPPASGGIVSGTTVGTWFDASGTGNHLSQATSALQPTYFSSGSAINGGPYLDFPITYHGGTTFTGPELVERTASLHTPLATSNSFLMLAYKYSTFQQTLQIIFTNFAGGDGAEYFIRYLNCFDRFNAGSTLAYSQAATHATIYTFTSGSSQENFYIDTAVSPGYSTTAGRPAMGTTPFQLSDSAFTFNGQINEILLYNSALTSSQLAQILAYWNGKYGTSFNTSVGPLTAPTISNSAVTQTGQVLSATSPIGGTGPYLYQWYRSLVNGTAASIAVSGNAVSGATTISFTDSGLHAQTNYYYVLKVTDSAGTPATVLSTVLATLTHGTKVVKVAFVGDSITTSGLSLIAPPSQFGLDLQAAYPGYDVQTTNFGAGGQLLRDLSRLTYGGGSRSGGNGITSLTASMVAAGITHCGIMEGTNDWGLSTSNGGSDTSLTPTNYLADMEDVISCMNTAGIKVYVNQLIFRTTSGADNGTTGLPAWNAELAALPFGTLIKQGDTSAYAFFKANFSADLSNDGLHPNTAGATALGNYWYAAMGADIAADFPTGTTNYEYFTENYFPPRYFSPYYWGNLGYTPPPPPPVTTAIHTTLYDPTAPYDLVSLATNNANVIIPFPGQLSSIAAFNIATSPRYLKFYDKSTTPNPAVDTPIWTVPISGYGVGGVGSMSYDKGLVFKKGIAFAITSGIALNDNTSIAANDVLLNISYR